MSLDQVADGGGYPPTAGRPFVGRDREMAELRAGLEEAAAGRGQLLLIAGEPGIGKTRLIDEFSSDAAARGVRVLWGACQGMGEPAYWPWLQIIRQRVRSCDLPQLVEEMGSGVADIAPLIDELRDRLPNTIVPRAVLETERARFRLFDSISTFLKNAARSQPVVLILDDLHWADEASLQLLQFLSRELRDARLLVIGTYRHDEIGRPHPLARALGDLTIGGRIVLAGLSRPEVGRFIGAILGIECPESVANAVHRRTEGNPFYVSEVVRLLASNGRLPRAQDIESGAFGIPQGVREVIGRRLDRLSEDCNRALTVAAVIGREFDIELLAEASGLTRARLVEVLNEAVAARVLVQQPSALVGFRFAHDLIRAALYGDLPADQRQQLHRRVGDTLEALCAGAPEPHLAELAHHFFEGMEVAEPTKATDYAIRAGEQALGIFAYEDAVKHFEHARLCLESHVDDTGGAGLCELLLTLGQAQMRAGSWREGKATLLRAAQIARQARDGSRLAAAALSLVNPFPTIGRVDPTRLALLEEALRGLPQGDDKLRSRIMARLAIEPQYASSDERRAVLSHEALEVARGVGDSVSLAHALFTRFWVLMASVSDPQELIDLATEVIDLGRTHRDNELALLGYNCRITVWLTLGDIAKADSDIAIHAQLASELRQPFHTFSTLALRATRAMLSGHFNVAEELAPQIAAKLGHEANARRLLDLLSFRLCYEQGWGEQVEALLRSIASRRATEPAFHAAAAAFYAEIESEAETRSEFEQAATNDFRDLPCDVMRLTTLSYLARACAFLRDRRRGELLYPLLVPHAGLHVAALSFSYLGSVAHHLGLLAAMLGRDDDSERHFQSALDLEMRIGAGPAVARTQLAYAELLLQRNRASDRERGKKHIEEALRAAQRLGMKGVERRLAVLCTSTATSADDKARAGDAAVFRQDGDYWTIVYQGRSIRLKDAKGLRDIAALLARPRDSVHVADLVAGCMLSPAGREYAPSDPALDGRARQEYRARLGELREELDDAERLVDHGRAERARAELDMIAGELAAAYGFGGRSRRPGDPAERARATVTMRIRASLNKIEKQHPTLGLHLSRSIKTGTVCSYEPEALIGWNL